MLGGGAGSILDMIKRVRDNSALLKKSRYFDSGGHNIKTYLKIKHENATPEQLQQVREKAKRQRAKNTIISVISLLLSILITAGLVYYFFGF